MKSLGRYGLASLLILASACGNGADDSGPKESAPERSRFEAAKETCQKDAGYAAMVDTVEVVDDGRTLLMSTEKDGLAGLEGVVCMLDELETPESVVNRVAKTTAMMGELTASADDLDYSWTYHPDNGLNMVVEDQRVE
ncbi:hypothetical protein [Nocardioides pakistanensis]